MADPVIIAIDAMGGDHAPRAVLRGANIARRRHPQVGFLIFGDESKLRPHMRKLKRLAKCATVVHTPDAVANDEKPAQALRHGRNSSMRLAIDAVRDGKAQAVVSGGNTGALMVMSKLVLRPLPGVDRPAMASFFPTMKGESVMLDLGANVECSAENLVQFAQMGELFSRTVLGTVRPTVGLLNVGSEEMKGNDSLREANALLRARDDLAYHGFIEGDDIAAGTVDVVVTDGFSGNVALKTAEGTAKLIAEFLRQTFKSSPFAMIGYLFARHSLRKLRHRMDPRRYNGAVFLGLNGVSVKSHGSADALGFATALGVAIDMVQQGFVESIKKGLPAAAPPPPTPIAAAMPATGTAGS